MNQPPSRSTPDDRVSLASLFAEITALAPAERPAAIGRAREHSPSIASELESLLAFHDEDQSILDRSPLVADLAAGGGDEPTPAFGVGATPPAADSLPGVILGEVISSGSRFVVYRAVRVPGGDAIAVRMVRPELVSGAMVGCFQSAGRLQWPRHPGIASVYGVHAERRAGSPQPLLAVIEELVEGPSITEYSVSRDLGLSGRVDLVAAACEAVAAGHASGVAHGNLSPSRLRVLSAAADEPGWSIKILGYGIERLLEPPPDDNCSQNTGSSGLVTVSPSRSRRHAFSAWVAPECRGGGLAPPDPRADVYSLGVIALEVLAGRPGANPDQVRGRDAAAIRGVVQRAISAAPSDRHADAGALLADILASQAAVSPAWWRRWKR